MAALTLTMEEPPQALNPPAWVKVSVTVTLGDESGPAALVEVRSWAIFPWTRLYKGVEKYEYKGE